MTKQNNELDNNKIKELIDAINNNKSNNKTDDPLCGEANHNASNRKSNAFSLDPSNKL